MIGRGATKDRGCSTSRNARGSQAKANVKAKPRKCKPRAEGAKRRRVEACWNIWKGGGGRGFWRGRGGGRERAGAVQWFWLVLAFRWADGAQVVWCVVRRNCPLVHLPTSPVATSPATRVRSKAKLPEADTAPRCRPVLESRGPLAQVAPTNWGWTLSRTGSPNRAIGKARPLHGTAQEVWALVWRVFQFSSRDQSPQGCLPEIS